MVHCVFIIAFLSYQTAFLFIY